MEEIKSAIYKQFHYLFDDDFEFVSAVDRGGMGGWYVVLRSPVYQIKIEIVKYAMWFYLAPLPTAGEEDEWMYLATVLSLLKNRYVSTPSSYMDMKLDRRLAGYHKLFYPYREQIRELYTPEVYKRRRSRLLQVRDEVLRRSYAGCFLKWIKPL